MKFDWILKTRYDFIGKKKQKTMVVDFLLKIIKCECFYWKVSKQKFIFIESDQKYGEIYFCLFIIYAYDQLILKQWTWDIWIYFSRSFIFVSLN